MLFNLSLLLALAVLCLGLVWRAWSWLHREVGGRPGSGKHRGRLKALGTTLARGAAREGGAARLARALLWEGLFQGRVFAESLPRWLAHQAVFWGFVLLILFHALESHVSEHLLPGYYSTVYPYALLRDVLGLAVLAGLAAFAWRRRANPVVRRLTGRADVLILVLLGVIVLSGFVLKAAKINSQTRFNQMVEEFAGLEEGPELAALQAVWNQRFGVVFDHDLPVADAAVMARGLEAHQSYCADCHSRPQSAFGSYALSRLMAPAASLLDSLRAEHWLWVLHFLACFLALALLPFTKLLHIVTTPLSLLADAALGRSGPAEPEPDETPARAARRALDLTACTGCATCSQHCSVLATCRVVDGDLALPSVKLAALTSLNGDGPDKLGGLRAAADLCTRCQRCTRVCPAGIDLQDLWTALDEEMDRRGVASVFAATRDGLVDNQKANGGAEERSLTVNGNSRALGVLDMALHRGYFRYCFQCQTCSNVCPVVPCFEHPGRELGLLPHQIMYSLELGLVEQATAAAMTWNCVTCYQCQQHCPQGVPVADLLYELRNQGFWLGGHGGSLMREEEWRS